MPLHKRGIASCRTSWRSTKLNRPWFRQDQTFDDPGDIPIASRRGPLREAYLRERLDAEQHLGAAFGDTARAALAANPATSAKLSSSPNAAANAAHRGALKALSLLRPGHPFRFVEAAEMNVKARFNRLTLDSVLPSDGLASSNTRSRSASDETGNAIVTSGNEWNNALPTSPGSALTPASQELPLFYNLPMYNPRAYVLAVDAVCYSLIEDIESVLKFFRIPYPAIKKGELSATRLECLTTILVEQVMVLRNTSHDAQSYASRFWRPLQRWMPERLKALSATAVGEWLSDHMTRALRNKQRCKHGRKQIHGRYDFRTDLIYDELPLPEDYIDAQRFRYPYTQAEKLLFGLAQRFGLATTKEKLGTLRRITKQYQDFVWDIKNLGIDKLRRQENASLMRYVPRGNPPEFNASKDDCVMALDYLKAAARGDHRFVLESVDPYAMLHKRPLEETEKTSTLDGRYLTESDIKKHFDIESAAQRATSRRFRSAQSGGVHKFIKEEMEQMRFDGPLEWLKEGQRYVTWRWRKPEDAELDHSTGRYLRRSDAINPLMNLSALRVITLSVKPMKMGGGSTVCRYSRTLVAVGDGQGYFGTAAGFGMSASKALKDGTLKALQNAKFVDHDSSGILCTPIQGREYGTKIQFLYRRAGAGVRANRRHLPLAYLMGFRHVFMRFQGKKSWLSRHRAMRRALEAIQSRRTLANATGQKYALLTAPGEHWVHWPDKWFVPIAKEYEKKLTRLRAQAQCVAYQHRRQHIVDVIPEQLHVLHATHEKEPPLTSWRRVQALSRAKAMRVYQTEMLLSATRKGKGPQLLRQQNTEALT